MKTNLSGGEKPRPKMTTKDSLNALLEKFATATKTREAHLARLAARKK